MAIAILANIFFFSFASVRRQNAENEERIKFLEGELQRSSLAIEVMYKELANGKNELTITNELVKKHDAKMISLDLELRKEDPMEPLVRNLSGNLSHPP